MDRREFFWEDLPEFGDRAPDAGETQNQGAAQEFHPGEFFSALLKQITGATVCSENIYVPVDFEDREELEEVLSEQRAGDGRRAMRVDITVAQRGDNAS